MNIKYKRDIRCLKSVLVTSNSICKHNSDKHENESFYKYGYHQYMKTHCPWINKNGFNIKNNKN